MLVLMYADVVSRFDSEGGAWELADWQQKIRALIDATNNLGARPW